MPAPLHAGDEQVADRERPEDREEHGERERDAIDLLHPLDLERQLGAQEAGLARTADAGQAVDLLSGVGDVDLRTEAHDRGCARAHVLLGLEPEQSRPGEDRAVRDAGCSTSDGTTTRPTIRYSTSPVGLLPVTRSPISAPSASIVSVPTATSSSAAGARPSSTVGWISPRIDVNPMPLDGAAVQGDAQPAEEAGGLDRREVRPAGLGRPAELPVGHDGCLHERVVDDVVPVEAVRRGVSTR